ncbi:uncharacterized protein LOC126611924 [Malus sylvestris]|uniref:uncharacterized protein LOC126611924 n=1 Tax=Malus sylvestris TaxID=3752 RepID=UPI0021AC37CE|nr:uncharacterized protein LOC126611924 [Malus sylvestris]
MTLVKVCKQILQSLRDDDFGDLLDDVQKSCEEHDIVVPNIEDLHFIPGKSKRKAPRLTNFHYYRVNLYFQVLDTQLKELNDRFDEVNTKLLLCMAYLSPVNNFASFDKAKIVRQAQLYPQDFDRMDLMNLPLQLDNYIHDMKMHSEFSSLREIGDLTKELVKTGRCASYILVYKLLTLALVLLVATASVERVSWRMADKRNNNRIVIKKAYLLPLYCRSGLLVPVHNLFSSGAVISVFYLQYGCTFFSS